MAGGHEEDEAEQLPLLQRAGSSSSTQAGSDAPGTSAAGAGASCAASSTSDAGLKPAPSSDTICRICLEDDVPGALEAPCNCAGTQRYAHPACIQRWVDEKRSLTCEICGAQYRRTAGKGAYTAPPPPPPESPSADALPQLTSAEREALRRLLTRITLVAPPGAGAHPQYAVEEAVELRPGVSWLLACFMMLLLLLNGGGDPSASPGTGPGGGDAGGGGGSDPFSPSGPGADDDGSGAASRGLVLMLCLFAVWVLTKMCVFTGSLFAAAHGWRSVNDSDGDDGDIEAGYPAGPGGGGARSVPVLVATGGPGSSGGSSSDALAAAAAGGAPDVELQRLRASGGRPHPVLVALHAISRHQRRQQRLRAQQQAGAATAAGDGEGAGSTPGRLIAIV